MFPKIVASAALSVIPLSWRNLRTNCSCYVKFLPFHTLADILGSVTSSVVVSSISEAAVTAFRASSRLWDEEPGNEKRRVALARAAILFW